MDIKTEEARILAFQHEIHELIKVRAEEKGLSDPECQPIYDGIADIHGYVSSKPKVMCVLKEAWGKKDEHSEKVNGGGYEIWEY